MKRETEKKKKKNERKKYVFTETCHDSLDSTLWCSTKMNAK